MLLFDRRSSRASSEMPRGRSLFASASRTCSAFTTVFSTVGNPVSLSETRCYYPEQRTASARAGHAATCAAATCQLTDRIAKRCEDMMFRRIACACGIVLAIAMAFVASAQVPAADNAAIWAQLHEMP